ncbi:hypothetical protein KC19_8G070000 [Ceratodon purpureus]|uniref:Uncharacterized protein n=1 Tax=Ceratodon purpureus TaxID=3225 RepID=A0A8T0H0P4_CERPU|nr:hypothetical protein KC19_8G070000 [Ceratodon purpureus]
MKTKNVKGRVSKLLQQEVCTGVDGVFDATRRLCSDQALQGSFRGPLPTVPQVKLKLLYIMWRLQQYYTLTDVQTVPKHTTTNTQSSHTSSDIHSTWQTPNPVSGVNLAIPDSDETAYCPREQ